MVRRFGAILALGALTVGTLLVIDRQLAGKIHPDATTVALAVVAVALVVALFYPHDFRRFLARVGNVKLGGVEVGLTQAERARVVLHLPPEDELKTPIDKLKETGTVLGDLYAVRNCLVVRLTWLKKELGLHADGPGEVLRELRTLELVDADQARFATDLLLPELSNLPSLPEDKQRLYIKRSWDFANRLRPTVFDQAVRAVFRAKSWTILDYAQAPTHRPDFLATASNHWLLVASRVALDANSATDLGTGQIAKTVRRWTGPDDRPPVQVESSVIVIPTTKAPAERQSEILVVRRRELPVFLDSLIDGEMG